MNKHLLEMYANLVIETQEIQDGDVKKLAEGILVLVKNYDNQAKEIERQKEIIKQLDIKNLELTTIVKEVREYNKEILKESWYGGNEKEYAKHNLEILDKVGE